MCGHAVAMGNKVLSGQNSEEVLTRFGKRINKTRLAYRQFVAEGNSQGRRNELVGGGMKSLSFLAKVVLEYVCQPHEVKQC